MNGSDLRLLLTAGALALALAACDRPPATDEAGEPAAAPAPSAAEASDPHSFAEPAEASVEHLALELGVDFAARRLDGSATLRLERAAGADRLVLDTRDLEIRAVTAAGREAAYRLGEETPFLGRALEIELPEGVDEVTVEYSTSPAAAALQWLTPEQTASGEHPFLFTQSQAILARTWVPIQDTPGVRFTYEATVRVPPGMLALMSANNPQAASGDGVYSFSMPQPIPSYLLALAVGDLEFRSLGEETGVYAEPAVIERAAWELADTQEMLETVEGLYGPYRWGRYDLLVLPPSFPFGGMENPRLTFATPTILAGDRSLVALVAHELAHSWSGNLVTNATWDDFWLNEGVTVYLEGRIMEALYGRPYAEMLAELARQDLEETMAELEPADQHLELALAGRDPDEGMTSVAYEKGALFLRMLEGAVGRERWDPFLRSWFEEHAFQSVTSDQFVAFLDERLLGEGGLPSAEELQVDAWVYGPGIPANAPEADSEELDEVEAVIARWGAGTPAAELSTEGWTSHHYVHFLRNLPADLTDQRLAELDQAFSLSATGNSEIRFAWLLQAIRNEYRPAYPAVEEFLTGMGRRKFLKPLYEELAKTDQGKELARRIYTRARPTYHSVSVNTIDEILDWGG